MISQISSSSTISLLELHILNAYFSIEQFGKPAGRSRLSDLRPDQYQLDATAQSLTNNYNHLTMATMRTEDGAYAHTHSF